MSDDFGDTTICPNCGQEGAYFNGINYECPDCDYEWSDEDESEYEDEWDEWNDEDENSEDGRLF
ncbi:MAG: hypothetical protein LBD58_11445 [Treponema sp.]|jgi:uncharacterized Zn ribbon protein|nr:hypothetical protein [Treponema sp.]